MKKVILWLFTAFIITAILTLVFIVVLPKEYGTPEYQVRAGTKYWTLSTGSRIGYTLVAAKGERKPYPVIFLQGGPGGPIYDRNIGLLSVLAEDGYDVYLYDQVGCGSSSRLKHIDDYSVNRHKRDLEEIVRIIGSKEVILIGQSWGAMLACAFIADNPKIVEKVIFTGPGPVLPRNTGLESIKAPDSLNLKQPLFTNRQGKDKVYNLKTTIVEFFARAFSWKLVSDAEMDAFSTLLNHEMSKSTLCNPDSPILANKIESGSGYYSMIKTVQSFNSTPDIRSKIKGCSVPALILRGQCDGIQWGYASEYLQLFTHHLLVIIHDAGHSVGREQPDAYLQTLRDFLKR